MYLDRVSTDRSSSSWQLVSPWPRISTAKHWHFTCSVIVAYRKENHGEMERKNLKQETYTEYGPCQGRESTSMDEKE